MKAVLVLQEMPENCHQCPVDCEAYMASDQVTFKARLEGCPLRPMPPKMPIREGGYGSDILTKTEHEGWNKCLKAIEGNK